MTLRESENVMAVLGYFSMILVGLALGLLGGGGAILTVPILVYLFHDSPTVATGYSLFLVATVSLFGMASYWKRKLVDVRTGLNFAFPSAIGVWIARSVIVPAVPTHLGQWAGLDIGRDFIIMVVFAIIMLLAALAMLRRSKPKSDENKETSFSQARSLVLIAEGLAVGFIAGFVGAGGGFLIVPSLVLLAKLPMRKAIGTSLFIITLQSGIGFLAELRTATAIDWHRLLLLAVMAIVGLFAGSALNQKIPEQKLKRAFGWFVLCASLLILLERMISGFL